MRSLNTQDYLLITVILLTALAGSCGLLIALLKLREEKKQWRIIRGARRRKFRVTPANLPPEKA